MTKEAKIYNGDKIASSVNDVRKTEQLYAKEWNWTTLSHHAQKQIQNGLKTNVRSETMTVLL